MAKTEETREVDSRTVVALHEQPSKLFINWLEKTEEMIARVMAKWGLRRSLLPGYLFGASVLYFSFEHAEDIVPDWNVSLTRATCALAGILGWIAGIMSLPETPWQETHFNRGWAAISTFAGGALVGQLVQSFSDVAKWHPNHWARLLLAAIWFCLGLLFTGAPRLLEPRPARADG
jgi:hypothetical protein